MSAFAPTVPIMGQPFKIVLAYSSAVIECQCDGKVTLLLPGKGNAAQCPSCGNVYAIAQAGEIAVGQLRSGSGLA